MINWKSILSSFNDKPTLLEWLKLVEKALKESVLKSVTTEQDADKANTKLIFNFEDGTQIETGFFPTKGATGRGIYSVTSIGQSQTGDGFTKTGFTVEYTDRLKDKIYLYAKNGKSIESFSSTVKEVTDENTVNTITVNYDDQTSNTFEITSARGKQGADGVSITGIETVSDEIVGDKTVTTLRANYSNNTSDEFVVAAQNGSSGGSGKLYIHRVSLKIPISPDDEYYVTVHSSDPTPITKETANRLVYGFAEEIEGSNGAYRSCTVKNARADASFVYMDGTVPAFTFAGEIESDTVIEV